MDNYQIDLIKSLMGLILAGTTIIIFAGVSITVIKHIYKRLNNAV